MLQVEHAISNRSGSLYEYYYDCITSSVVSESSTENYQVYSTTGKPVGDHTSRRWYYTYMNTLNDVPLYSTILRQKYPGKGRANSEPKAIGRGSA